MIKTNKWKLVLASAIILLPALVGLLLWNSLPEYMATHWGLLGDTNGWSGRAFVVFGIPAIFLAIYWLCMLVTMLDPKMKHQTRRHWD